MKAFIFDFDGLIIDTELAEFETWREIYAEHGATLTFEVWGDVIGAPANSFDPVAYLEQLTGKSLGHLNLREERRRRTMERIAKLPLLPGVETYLSEGKRRGFLLGVASNSSLEWVAGHLERAGILDLFDVLRTADHVERPKPAPDLYQAVLDAFGIGPDEAVAFEDSPHGVKAAQAAGIYCVAVPNTLTRRLDLSHADLLVPSLADLPVDDLLHRVQDRRRCVPKTSW